MTAILTDESLDQKAESAIRALIAQAVELRELGHFQASYDLLSRADLDSVSISRQGRFFNQRALALKDLGEYDRAILEFDRAADCFESSGEQNLQGIVKNNLARVYSLSGNYDRAHESVDHAIRLITNKEWLGQCHDQKAKIYLDESRGEQAEIESRKAVELLEHSEHLNEAIVTRAIALVLCDRRTEARRELATMFAGEHTSCFEFRSMLEDSPNRPRPDDTLHDPHDQGKRSMAAMLARSRELIRRVTRNNDAEHAWEIIELLDIASKANNPIIEHDKRFLFTLTDEFEEDFQRRMARVRPPPITDLTSSEN